MGIKDVFKHVQSKIFNPNKNVIKNDNDALSKLVLDERLVPIIQFTIKHGSLNPKNPKEHCFYNTTKTKDGKVYKEIFSVEYNENKVLTVKTRVESYIVEPAQGGEDKYGRLKMESIKEYTLNFTPTELSLQEQETKGGESVKNKKFTINIASDSYFEDYGATGVNSSGGGRIDNANIVGLPMDTLVKRMGESKPESIDYQNFVNTAVDVFEFAAKSRFSEQEIYAILNKEEPIQ